MTIYKRRNERASWAGETIGILVLNNNYPYLPGNVQNATTYDYPVRYAEVHGATSDRLLYEADPALVEPFVDAAKQLEADGVGAITGACGFMALFQHQLQAAVSIPVLASSLLQIPFIYAITGKRIGVITADSSCLKPEHFTGAGVSEDIPLAIGGMENNAAFVKAILNNGGELDDDAVCKGVVELARNLKNSHDDLGALLLECSDLPPYAHAIQSAVDLPVFDFITMIDYVHRSLRREPYQGYL